MSTSQEWKAIGGRIEGVFDDPRFAALFEAALNSDAETNMIQFQMPSGPHLASVVLLNSAADMKVAITLGQDISSGW